MDKNEQNLRKSVKFSGKTLAFLIAVSALCLGLVACLGGVK